MQSEGRNTRILTCLFPHVSTLKLFSESGQIGRDGGRASGGRCQEDGGGGE